MSQFFSHIIGNRLNVRAQDKLSEGDIKLGVNVVLVSYSEIALKSPPVRRRLESLLINHIRLMLKKEGITQARVGRIQGRLTIENVDSLKASEVVSKNVFGISSVMPALRIENDLDTISNTCTQIASEFIQPNQTFAVRARRIVSQGYTSKDIEVKSGEMILGLLSNKGVRVNLNSPDKTIFIEVREDAAYVYTSVFHGIEGLPFGSQGKLIGLFSGGIDSPVAVWLMMKRGANVIPLFLDQRPFVGDDYFERMINVTRHIRQYVPFDIFSLYSAPMGEIMRQIIDNVPSRFFCVICKRMMYRTASGLAMLKKAGGIVTGESLGQVASQTLANLSILDEVSPLPVYRPLISFEKNDIVTLARKIGTYDSSVVKIHGCSVVPSKPTTRARLETIKTVEKDLDIDYLISETLSKLKVIQI